MPDFDLRKALDTTGVGNTGTILVPEVIEAGLNRFIETRSPIWNIIPKVRAKGMAYFYKELNGLPTASFGAEMQNLPAATAPTFADRNVPIKSIYTRGEISGQLIEATRTFIDVLAEDIELHMTGLVRELEVKTLSGNATSFPNEFNGLDVLITNVYHNDTVGDGSGTDQELTLAALDAMLDLPAGGTPTHLFMSKAMKRKLWSMLQPQVRFMSTQDIEGGFTVATYMGLPVFDLFDNTSLLANKIIAPQINDGLVFYPVLKDMSFEPLAKDKDSYDYMIKMYLTLVVKGAARHHVKMEDVTSTIS